MSQFAVAFKTHVMPRIKNLCRAEAYCIHHGAETWEGAHIAVMRYAHRYGANYLPGQLFSDLDSWVSATILDAMIALEKKPDPDMKRAADGLVHLAI